MAMHKYVLLILICLDVIKLLIMTLVYYKKIFIVLWYLLVNFDVGD